MVRSLVRLMPAWNPRISPKRYSSPISAPNRGRRNLRAGHLKSPCPSGRENRCVTRKALLNCGSLSVVGRVTIVKSGCAGLRSRSGRPVRLLRRGSCRAALRGGVQRQQRSERGGRRGGALPTSIICPFAWGVSGRCARRPPVQLRPLATAGQVRQRVASVIRRPQLDPALDDRDLTVGQEGWPVVRHSEAEYVRPACQLANEVAVLRVTGDHASRRRPVAGRHVYQLVVSDGVLQVEPTGKQLSRSRCDTECTPSGRTNQGSRRSAAECC